MGISTAKLAVQDQPVLHTRAGSTSFSCTAGRCTWDPGALQRKQLDLNVGERRGKRRKKEKRKKSGQHDINVREGREKVAGR